jgi:methionine synthase I (cobalamin-dependent)
MTNSALQQAIQQRILVLDGAMGTMIQRHQLEEFDFREGAFEQHPMSLKGNNDLLSITRPEIIKGIHRAYLAAGADIIETNTFSGTTIAQADYQLEAAVYQINFQGAKIAKEVAAEFTDRPRFVAGSIGPTNRTASISPDVNDPGFRAVSFDELVEAYSAQIEALMDGGVDILLIETVFDTLNAKAALYACDQVFDKTRRQNPNNGIGYHYRSIRAYPHGPNNRSILDFAVAHAPTEHWPQLCARRFHDAALFAGTQRKSNFCRECASQCRAPQRIWALRRKPSCNGRSN